MKEKESTKTLVRRAQDGDRDALDALDEYYRARVEHFVKTRLGVLLKQHVEADDIVQETFLQAFKSIPRFRWQGEDSFVRWLNGIAEHVILKLADRFKRHQKLSLERDVPAGSHGAPSKAPRREERFARLQKALDILSPDQKEAILLSRIDGLRVKEIADKMNRTQNAVLLLISRGLSKLKDNFGETESLHLPPRSLREQGSGNDEP